MEYVRGAVVIGVLVTSVSVVVILVDVHTKRFAVECVGDHSLCDALCPEACVRESSSGHGRTARHPRSHVIQRLKLIRPSLL